MRHAHYLLTLSIYPSLAHKILSVAICLRVWGTAWPADHRLLLHDLRRYWNVERRYYELVISALTSVTYTNLAFCEVNSFNFFFPPFASTILPACSVV